MCIAHLWCCVYTKQLMPTGEIEVLAESVEVYNMCRKLPFEIKDFVKVGYLNPTRSDHFAIVSLSRCVRLDRNRSLWGCSIVTWISGPLGCRGTSGWDLSWWWRWESSSAMCTVCFKASEWIIKAPFSCDKWADGSSLDTYFVKLYPCGTFSAQ